MVRVRAQFPEHPLFLDSKLDQVLLSVTIPRTKRISYKRSNGCVATFKRIPKFVGLRLRLNLVDSKKIAP